MFTAKLRKKEGKLIYATDKDKLEYELFLDKLEEGDEVEVFMDKKSKDGSLAQLAKVHACIRILAQEAGYSFSEMKQLVKENTGLVSGDEIKSFKDCDQDELSAAIQTCVHIGEMYNINLA